jgi:DNA polymerase-3 subunit gamma/tau
MATTDDHKIPDTIISRSVVIGLATPTSQVVSELIDRTAIAEAVILSPDARDMIVVAADGSFRNALVALETVIRAANGSRIDVDLVADVLSLPPLAFVRDMVNVFAYPSKEGVLGILVKLPSYNSLQLLRMVLGRLRMVLEYRFQIIKFLPETDKELVVRIAKDITGSKINAALLTTLLRLETDMIASADPLMTLQAHLYGLLEVVGE